MRRTLFALLLLGSGCIAGTMAVERDDRILREIARQERWAQQAIDARPDQGQLESIRESDYRSVGAARRELQKLIAAVDRGTWIRDTTAELMKDDADPQLARDFDRGGTLRTSALQAADEIASALAEAHGGVTMADLKPGFDAIRRAQASEDRLAKLPARAGVKLAPAPLPAPQPLLDAAAKLASAGPDAAKDLDRLSPEDQARVRARLADRSLQKEGEKHAAPPPPPGAGTANAMPPPPAPGEEGAVEAEAPSPTLKIANDAAALLARKAPRSITLREDGLFALSYDDADYLVEPGGKLVRKEPPAPTPGTPVPPPPKK